MPTVHLSDGDPAYDLVALIEKMTVTDEKEKSARSPLAALVEQKKYTQLLEDGFFARIEQILGGPEDEVDVTFSLCFSLLHTVESDSVSDMILRLATALSKDHTTHPNLKLRLLCELFNILDTPSPLRVTVITHMLRLALASNNSDMVMGQFKKLGTWLDAWNLSDEQQGDLYLLMSQCHAQANSAPLAKYYQIKYLKTFQSADTKRLDSCVEQAVHAVKAAISDPNVLQCDGLLNLAAVRHLTRPDGPAPQQQLHRLFSIFTSGTVHDFKAFAAENKESFATLELNEEDCFTKIRRLSLITLAATQGELTYEAIQKACALEDLDEVEDAVIDAVGAGCLDAKLDQENNTVQIRRVDQRSFAGDEASWRTLNDQLSMWSRNISSVLHHMSRNRAAMEDDLMDE